MNCQQATELASRQRDEKLTLAKKLNLSLHLMMCTHCKNFNKNIVQLSGSMQSFLKDSATNKPAKPPEESSEGSTK